MPPGEHGFSLGSLLSAMMAGCSRPVLAQLLLKPDCINIFRMRPIMADKGGNRDKVKKEQQKKPKLNPKEKRKAKIEKKAKGG